MTGSRHSHQTFVLVAGLVAAAVAACSDAPPIHERDGPPAEGVYVPVEWSEARTVSGHDVHVLDERIACTECHEFSPTSVGDASPERCAGCHEEEARIEHAAAAAERRWGPGVDSDCTTCHWFTRNGPGPRDDAGEVPRATDCRRCHSTQQTSIPAVVVHGTSGCVKCHRPHEDASPKAGDCRQCHDDVSTAHAAEGRSVVEICTTCHQHQHAPSSDALGTCVDCHRAHEPIVPEQALFEEGHRECIGCHRPHAFDQSATVPCRSCHEGKPVLGAHRVPAHQACNNCHDAHNVLGAADQACSRCHDDVHPDHPKHGVAGTCVGCHDPHPPAQHATARARECSTCHQVPASDDAFHQGVSCRECHSPHQFQRSMENLGACRQCHDQQVGLAVASAGHQSCEGCHAGLPHRPARRQVGCEECHAQEHAAVRSGHEACLDCHEPHGGDTRTECSSCHAGQHRSAPPGHRECLECHDQHSGAMKRGCASCHAEQAESPHGALASDCSSCHRPHGPGGVAEPPPCATCHERANLPGLHREPRHGDCGRCHDGHGHDVPDLRRSCLTCHTDRRDHFPEAPSCASCHLFGPNR